MADPEVEWFLMRFDRVTDQLVWEHHLTASEAREVFAALGVEVDVGGDHLVPPEVLRTVFGPDGAWADDDSYIGAVRRA